MSYKDKWREFDKRRGKKTIELKINVLQCINILKETFSSSKKREKYEWIYECSLDPTYKDDYCIAHNGYLSDPYCKHGLRLIRKKEVR